MNELEFEAKCKDTIKNCMWREETFGTGRLTICRAECLPCKRCIELGRMEDWFKKELGLPCSRSEIFEEIRRRINNGE